ncbi:MAG: hypothetical protein ACP6IP_10815 [Candidatus Njordarchaeia archaeon]
MNPKPLKLECMKTGLHNCKKHPEDCELYASKESIKSACEFYLRYKDNPELLIKEHPEYKKEIGKINDICPYCAEIKNKLSQLIPTGMTHLTCKKELYKCSRCGSVLCLECDATKDKTYYNLWLFKLAFRDVFKERD